MRNARLLGVLVLQGALMTWVGARVTAVIDGSTPAPEYEEGFLERPATESNTSNNEFDVTDKSCIIIDGYATESVETCYENAEKSIPIMLRKEWDGEMDSIESSSPVEYVVIKDGRESCFTSKDCLEKVQLEKKKTRQKSCELRENFYVGGDGNVYEGRGWNIIPYWHLNGLRDKSITFHFMGVYKNSTPSHKAIEAFETTMEIGLWLGKLSKSYKIVSMRHVLNDITLLGDAMNREVMNWKRWSNESSLHFLWDYTVPSRLRFVFRRHWNASSPLQLINCLDHPIEHVIIWEGGERCTSRAECISRIKAEQVADITHYGDLLDNFYIGDGDEVYEGRGWDFVPHWHLKGIANKYISIRLQGSFEHDLPTDKAMNSLKHLVETGVWLGKISPTFKMISLRQVYNSSSLLGEAFHRVVERWRPWSEEISLMSTARLESSGLLPFISRRDWNASVASKSMGYFDHTSNYVMVGDGGDRCYTVESCILAIRKEQRDNIDWYGDLLDNFYVGDDGNIYEGRGWNTLPHWHAPFFNRSFISVKFMGSFKANKPSWLALQAFDSLIKFGIGLGRILPNYKLYSFRRIYNDSTLMSDGLEGYMETLKHWASDLSLIPEDERASLGLLPVISSSEWKSIGTPNDSHNLSFVNVVVNDLGSRCFTLRECTSEILSLRNQNIQLYGGVPDNFYVGDDGRVFEGRGWNSLSHNQPKSIKSNLLFVSFFGRFQNTLPSPLALLAFHCLTKFGTSTGKLSNDYKIFSLSELFDDNAITGRMFSESVKTWDRWSDHVPFSPANGVPSQEQSIFVPRAQWNATSTHPGEELTGTVDFVIILDGGARCYSRSECISTINDQEKSYSGNGSVNFYIGEDGHVYEGRGWSPNSVIASLSSGIPIRYVAIHGSITVSFLGRFQLNLPSAKAYDAFDYLIKWGLVSKKLKPKYELKAMQHLFPLTDVPGGVLSLNIKTWDNWSEKKPSLLNDMLLSPVQPKTWGNTQTIRRSNHLQHPLKYVYIRDGGEWCFDYAGCVASMKKLEKNDSNGIKENFYIGGHGYVFEGIGWIYDMYWGFSDWQRSVTVQFLGSFDTDLPSSYDLSALDLLINKGLKLRYLSPNYEIKIIPFSYKSRFWAGAKLRETIKTWNRFTN